MPLSLAADRPAYTAEEEWAVLSLVNQLRAEERRQPLSVFDELQAAADLRATEIATRFSHTRPDNSGFDTALSEIQFTSAGENIAAGQRSAAAVFNAWSASAGHLENMVNADYKHMACGYYYASGSEYGTYWTQLFVGGCTTTAINNVGSAPRFDLNGNLLSTDNMLSITCNRHGTSYVALKDVSYYCSANQYGDATYTVTYDGVTKHLPCTVGFTDLNEDAWYQDSITYAVKNRLMNGMTSTTFAPDATMTRAQLVTVLHRLERNPAPTTADIFSDVSSEAWYADAVHWAAEIGLVNGIGDQLFAPDKPITRAELSTILLRYHQMNSSEQIDLASLASYADSNAVPAWAKTSLQWAVNQGLINGVPRDGGTYLDFDGSATRAQVATILMRYIENS